MAQALVENSERVSIRITTEDKSLLVRAASLENNERLKLSEKDTLRVMELLDNPPKPNAKLLAAAFALPDNA